MRLEWHVAATLVIGGAVVLLPISEKMSILSALLTGGVLIDIADHGLYAVVKTGSLKWKDITGLLWKKHKKMEPGFYIFHLWETYIACWFLLSKSYWGNWFLMAYTVHLVMDVVWYLRAWKNWRWLKYWSVVGYLR